MGLNTEATAALVYLILYVIVFSILILGYATGRLELRSRFTVITFHVAVRLASQAVGLAFGIEGFSNINLLIAYFILGAEGYFTLVLCTYRCLISWHYHNFESNDSWLEPRLPPGTPFLQRLHNGFAVFGSKRRPMTLMHYFLIGANAIIIAGGVNNSRDTGRIMRTVGQSIFLTVNTILLACIFQAMQQYRRERPGRKMHPTLYVLLAAWPLLCVRGLYGLLAGIYPPFSYFNPDNYDANGLTDAFVISEYILSTTMEWASCVLLMLTYVTSRNDPPLPPLKEQSNGGKDNSMVMQPLL
ncbi:hypothetical protein LshimejAT787_0201870 [Lyophyllum shimeji]|uniref:Uncharacterized protein n=1 Tax=Lyophyllum shimeji TaxID=47721 RepID=A0A9P3PFU3_LYOSH|nr:hypothetical protein LshimejAT787_0201870 [Lyophyllum shimeji]